MPDTVAAIKSVTQRFEPEPAMMDMMEIFLRIINDCIRIGLDNNVSTMKKLCSIAYKQLSCYDILSYYKLCAILHTVGILANRKKSIQRNLQPRHPFAARPLLISCYGFKITDKILKVPVGNRQYYDIQLNSYVSKVLSDPSLRVRSFTLAANSVSICYSREVEVIECKSIEGVDRNLRNLTIGNSQRAKQYDLSKAVDIVENTKSIVKSFKRNDVRLRKKLHGKYGERRKNRIDQLLHSVSKEVVRDAKKEKTAIAFEDIRGIRRLYQRGNYSGRSFRGRMNSWSFAEVKRQIEYKAAWEGLPTIQLSVNETRGTSQLCPRCGKKITQVDKFTRQLWCDQCKVWMDRDMVAAMNISTKGLARFASSQGLAVEAMKGNLTTPVILRVDASKLSLRQKRDLTEPFYLSSSPSQP